MSGLARVCRSAPHLPGAHGATAMQNQRADLLAFASVLDEKLNGIARAHQLLEQFVHVACVLYYKPCTSPTYRYWQGWNRLRARIGGKFHAVFDAVVQDMVQQRAGGKPEPAAPQLSYAAATTFAHQDAHARPS